MVSRWFGMSRTVKKPWRGTEPNKVRGLAIWNFLNSVEADFGRLGDLGRRSFIADLFCLYLRFFPLADALNSLEGTARIKRRSHVLLALEGFPNNLHCFFCYVERLHVNLAGAGALTENCNRRKKLLLPTRNWFERQAQVPILQWNFSQL